MAIERRVKPSERARQVVAEKRKLIIIIAVIAVVVIAGIVAAVKIVPALMYGEPLPWQKDKPGTSENQPGQGGPSSDAIKAMLEQVVSYEGTWYEDKSLDVQIYVPGTEKFTHDGQVSTVLYKNAGGTAVYGVVMGNALPTLNDDVTGDIQAVMDATVSRITPDISAGLYGAHFSASYEASTTRLGDNTPAVMVSGDMLTILTLQPEGSTEQQTITYTYPMCGIAFVRNDIPIMVWGVVDSDDSGEAQRLPGYMSECATILSSITANKNTAEEG